MKQNSNYTFDQLKNACYTQGNANVAWLDDGTVSVSDKVEGWATIATDCLKVIGAQKAYRTKYLIKLADENAVADIHLTYEIFMEYLDVSTSYHYECAKGTVNGKEWTEITGECTILEGAVLQKVIIAPYCGNQNFFVKDICVETFEPPKQIEFDITLPKLKGFEKTMFGAIYWDAWSDSLTENTDAHEVARSLAPKKYHSVAPYFSDVVDGKIVLPPTSQERVDQQILLAKDAGIDYFAYFWCGTDKDFHLTSKYRNEVKMAAIVISWSLQPQNIHSVIKALSSDCYLRIDNRPVLFVYGIYSIPKELLDATKAAAKEAGIKEELFLVCMSTTDVFAIHTMRERGFEAISKYSCGAFAPNEPYVELAKRAYDGNITQYDYSKTIRSIPLITFGRDSRPRIETKLSFCGDYGGMFAFPPTDEELYNHITQVTQYILDHKEQNEINSVVMYAWNEHDEGGWICPTLAVDQNGEPIKDENGKNKMNRSHLDVLKRAISDYRKKENK